MSINPALGAGMNIQANYAVTSTVNTYDTPDVWNDRNQGEAEGLEKEDKAQQGASASKNSQAAKSGSAQSAQSAKSGEAGKAGGTGEAAGAGEAGQAAQAEAEKNAETIARTLRLSMADNSKELQAKFNESQATRNDQPTMSQDARRQVMLRNMENMVNLQLAQYTGNEPYSKANYREILGAVTNMQGNGKSSETKDSDKAGSSSEGVEAGKAEEKDGVYKLYSGQAAKTLAALNNPRGGGDDSFDLVA